VTTRIRQGEKVEASVERDNRALCQRGTGAMASRGKWVLALLVLALMIALGLVVGPNTLGTLQQVLALAVFAVATNLLLGYGGLISFGQGVFFGIGAYTVALGWLHWHASFWSTFIAAPFVAAAVAIPVGLIALRARKLYFALSTFAFSQLFWQLSESAYAFTQGDNGIFGALVPERLGQPVIGYFFLLAVATVSLLLMYRVIRSPFGLVLRATRENPERMSALGTNVYLHQTVAFTISAFFCGLAGAMFTIYSQSAYPTLLDWTSSAIPVFMSVIGGMGSFVGPVVGAFVYQFAHDVLVLYVRQWQLILGLILLLIVMFWPQGIAGSVEHLWARVLHRNGDRHGDH
jgi:branched-chain amino acid transport system permease protein